MASYPGPSTSYPHHPQPHTPIHAHGQNLPPSESLPAHHGVPQPYYDSPLPPTPQQQQQHQQHQQSYGNGSQNGHGEGAQQGQPGSASGGEGQKVRLRKACDSCSIRKVKCDEAGPPCRACAMLEIPCTFERPSRRRGPPNRHAEAIKKRKMEEAEMLANASMAGAPLASAFPSPGYASPTSPGNIAATLASFSSHAVLNAETICPFAVLELLVNDFFTYIHPLAPLPHEPSFRDAFHKREDLKNPTFLALLASMVGALVASFPRRPRLHLKALRQEHLFPSSMSLVDRCHKIAVEARGPGYLDKELTVYDAVTSYFLGLCGAYSFQWRQCRIYFGETLNLIRLVGAHKSRDAGLVDPTPVALSGESHFDNQNQPDDFIKQEIGRRLFYIMIVGIRSMQQLGATFGELLIPPPTPTDPYPPLPMEVDDQYIYVNRVDSQPLGSISKLAGFNLGIKIYMSVTPLATMEMAYGIDAVFDLTRQRRIVEECLRKVKDVLNTIPRELMLTPSTQPGHFEQAEKPYFPAMANYPVSRSNGSGMEHPPQEDPERRKIQYEIQKANIYASQLGTRSYLVEKYWSLQSAYDKRKTNSGKEAPQSSPGAIATGLDGMMSAKSSSNDHDAMATNVANEREKIVEDLLRVLNSISQANMEPNGHSFINKIRQIASTLVDTPKIHKGPLAQRAEEYLSRFLVVLMRLERVSPQLKSEYEDLQEDDEEQLRNWADMREFQMRFANSGGFLNDS